MKRVIQHFFNTTEILVFDGSELERSGNKVIRYFYFYKLVRIPRIASLV